MANMLFIISPSIFPIVYIFFIREHQYFFSHFSSTTNYINNSVDFHDSQWVEDIIYKWRNASVNSITKTNTVSGAKLLKIHLVSIYLLLHCFTFGFCSVPSTVAMQIKLTRNCCPTNDCYIGWMVSKYVHIA